MCVTEPDTTTENVTQCITDLTFSGIKSGGVFHSLPSLIENYVPFLEGNDFLVSI